MFLKNSARIVWRACQEFSAHEDSRLGAALAYYTLFSIAPLIVIAIHVAGVLYGEEAARGQISAHLGQQIGKEAADAVETLVQRSSEAREGFWASLVGFVIMIVGAIGLFVNLRGALGLIWKLEPLDSNGWINLLWDYVLALIMVLAIGALLLLSMLISAFLPFLEDTVSRQIPALQVRWHLMESGASLVLLTLLFAALFRILSSQRIAWGHVWFGALVTAFLFTLGKVLLGLYLYYTGTASAYGAAGSLVVFLIWVYYSSQILFFGAELVQARRTRHEWLDGDAIPSLPA